MIRTRISQWLFPVLVFMVSPSAAGLFDRPEPGPDEGRTEPLHFTYLDTLNSGKEVTLGENDFVETHQSPPAISQAAAAFHIQCLASTDQAMVKTQQESAQKQTGLPAYVIYQQPYYKLYVGNFSNREEAEKSLERVKKSGYPQAWIISGHTASTAP